MDDKLDKSIIRRCYKCKEIKSVNDFYCKNGCCKSCDSKRKSKFYQNNKEYIKQRNKKWQFNNKEKIYQSKLNYVAKNRDHITKRLKIYHIKHRDRRIMRGIELTYGITQQEYAKLKLEANGKCIICQKLTEKLNIDHCHVTGKVRGLLCRKCNFGLGNFNDSIECLKSAIEYLEKHQDE